jgi:hypothetical protein
MHGAKANIADAMGQRGGQHLKIFGRLQNLPGAGHRRAIGGYLQVLVAEGCRQVFCLAAGDDQLPTLGSKLGHHGTPDAAGGTGDQCDFVHVGSLVDDRFVLNENIYFAG